MQDQASLAALSAEQFLAKAEAGEVLIDTHMLMLRIAYIHVEQGMWDDNGVFGVVDQLHIRQWSFGEGELKFNRYAFGDNPFHCRGN